MENNSKISLEEKNNGKWFLSSIIKNKKKELIGVFTLLSFLWAPDINSDYSVNFSNSKAIASTLKSTKIELKNDSKQSIDKKQEYLDIATKSIILWRLYYKEKYYERAVYFLENWLNILKQLDIYANSMEYAESMKALAFAKTMFIYQKILDNKYELVEIKSDEEWIKYKKEELPKILSKRELKDIWNIIDLIEEIQYIYDYQGEKLWPKGRSYLFKKQLENLIPILMVWKFLDNAESSRENIELILKKADDLNIDNISIYSYYLEMNSYPIKK